MIYDSLADEERFNRRLARLSKMTAKDKRKMRRLIDETEKELCESHMIMNENIEEEREFLDEVEHDENWNHDQWL